MMPLVKNPSLMTNGEGYPDPTSYSALKPIIAADQAKAHLISDLVHIMRDVADLAGFEVVGRIALKDKKTGNIYR